MTESAKAGYERYFGAVTRQYTPDRVPCVPDINPYTLALWYGTTPGAINRGEVDMLDLAKKAIEEFGPWDADNRVALNYCGTDFMCPSRLLLPGIHLPDESTNVADEKELITLDEYDQIIERGWEDVYINSIWPKVMDMPGEEYYNVYGTMEQAMESDKKVARELGIELTWTNAVNVSHPFFMLSLGRSFTPFTEDLFFRKEKTKKVIKIINDYLIERALKAYEITGSKIMEYTDERASAYMYPLTVFEEFWMPFALEYIDALWSKGIVSVIHCDTNWIKNLPYFKKFPKGSICIQFDSTTPIFEAKELLGDHIQYWGDVSASLLAYGKPEEVTAYCNRLIKEVGKDGGFVLTPGCEAPVDCKKENFRAMLEAARNSKY